MSFVYQSQGFRTGAAHLLHRLDVLCVQRTVSEQSQQSYTASKKKKKNFLWQQITYMVSVYYSPPVPVR